ncbi:MAG: phosphatase PAP2 family protein [Bacteroidales bacterium]
MIEQLKHWDEQLFLFFNGYHNEFWDFVMYWASEKYIWIPLYALFFYLLLKHFQKHAIPIILLVIVLIFLTDQSSVWIKNSVERLRPCHEPELDGMVHLVKEKCGGAYGFISSHAANHFGIAVFLSLIFNKKIRFITSLLILWAIFVSYSRIYLGVHYPGDLLSGAIVGILSGWIVFKSGQLLCLRGCLS